MTKLIESIAAAFALLGASEVLSLAAAEAFPRLFSQLVPEEARLRLHKRDTATGLAGRTLTSDISLRRTCLRIQRFSGDFTFTYTTDEHAFCNVSSLYSSRSVASRTPASGGSPILFSSISAEQPGRHNLTSPKDTPARFRDRLTGLSTGYQPSPRESG